MSVVQLDERRPHLKLACRDGHAHVFPVALALAWAAGSDQVEPPEPCIVRRIMVEWLACVHAGCVEHACEDV